MKETDVFPITVIGRNVEVTDAMKQYAEDKVSKMERFSYQILEAIVTMDITKLEHKVSIVLKVGHTRIKVSARSEDMYASVDFAVDKLRSTLWRYRSRLKDHHARDVIEEELELEVVRRPGDEYTIDDINDEIEEANLREVEKALEPAHVVAKETCSLKTLTMDEALMMVELSKEPCFPFRCEEDQTLKVIYQRDDGDYAIIELK